MHENVRVVHKLQRSIVQLRPLQCKTFLPGSAQKARWQGQGDPTTLTTCLTNPLSSVGVSNSKKASCKSLSTSARKCLTCCSDGQAALPNLCWWRALTMLLLGGGTCRLANPAQRQPESYLLLEPAKKNRHIFSSLISGKVFQLKSNKESLTVSCSMANLSHHLSIVCLVSFNTRKKG